MKIFLAGFKTIDKKWNKSTKNIYLLSSYYEHKTGSYGDYVLQNNHLLDSGAFSFFGGKKVDWKKYTENYCEFINKTKQKYFFELDIDNLESLTYAEYLRKMIEDKTGIQPIPVWRPSRGIDYWYKMCEEFNYISISASGAYDSAWTRKKESIPIIAKMLSIANKNNTKVHGLGFTSIPLLSKLKFYSVDSTTWLSGGRFGEICLFEKNQITKIRKKNHRLKNATESNLHNFNEWVKFQKYADANL